MKARLGREFGIALCDHFNVPAGQVEVLKVHTGFDEVFSASLTIMLTADDLAAIAARMDGKTPESAQEPVSVHFDPPATDADLARFNSKQRNTINVSIAPPDGVTAADIGVADIGVAVSRQIDRAMKRHP